MINTFSDGSSADTQVILMLVSRLGQTGMEDVSLLRQSEIAALTRWLGKQDLSPADLLDMTDDQDLREIGIPEITMERVRSLLDRGVALALAVERWSNSGLWTISWSDADYPSRFKERLKGSAAPILHGIGERDYLSRGGLAVVGSRKVDEAGLEFTQMIAELCADQGMQIISGGARGVDAAAMSACIEHGGHTIGVLAENLARSAVSGEHRDLIMDGKLTLISPFDPDARFMIGNAMARNKFVYALADYALVVSSDYEKGGTWAGATENLKKGWTPLFVRSGDGVPEGNRRLLRAGGVPIDESVANEEQGLSEWLASRSAGGETGAGGEKSSVQLGMF